MNEQTLTEADLKTHIARSRAALQAGDTGTAWRHLEAAQALDPQGRDLRVQKLHVELLLQADRSEAAIALLKDVIRSHPEQAWAHKFLVSQSAKNNKGRETAAFLDSLLSQGGTDNPRILLSAARVHRDLGADEDERAVLARAIACDPLDPGLLRYLFSIFPTPSDPGWPDRIVALLRGRADPELVDEVHMRLLMKSQQGGRALQAVRRIRKAHRIFPEAQFLMAALFEAHRYRTGLRYLRCCLRRWPHNSRLLSTYIRRSLRFGRFDEAERHLQAADVTRHPEHILEAMRFQLCGHRLDLDGVVASYERLKALGRLTYIHRKALAKMAFVMCTPTEAKALFERIGDPLPSGIHPHMRLHLEGRLRSEIELEAKAEENGQVFASLPGKVQAWRGSTSAAIQLVDAWRAAPPPPPDPDAPPPDPVPRRIVQYWDGQAMPDAMVPMVDSWRAAPGFDHRLYDGRSGAAFLRENLGPRWVSAFRMARNEAQRSDFLRLCLLAHGGGVYADADDYLYGELETILSAGPGLILHREPMGGVLGNNFLAAPPRHPVIVYAARLARAALLQRASEIAWNRTGPGLLTRAVGQYLATADPAAARRQVTILNWPQIAGHIAMHNPLNYKTEPQHWTHPGVSDAAPWAALEAALGGAGPDAAAGGQA